MRYDLNTIVELIRDCHNISRSVNIVADTELENDLGITGDDGADLIDYIQNELELSFIGSDGTMRSAFGLAENQYLFHGEGFSLNIFSKKENVKVTKVEDIHFAVNQVSAYNGN